MGLKAKLVEAGKSAIKRAIYGPKNYRLNGLITNRVIYGQPQGGPRMNIVIPEIRSAAAFGGISTALRFFHALRQGYARSRIIVANERGKDFETSRWSGWVPHDDSSAVETIVYLQDIDELCVEADDVFIATYWTTAEFILRISSETAKKKGYVARPFVYLIQDFEPGFYQWSSQYLLATSTYQSSENTIAVFNTQLLSDYFDLLGIRFSHSHFFEPKLNDALMKEKARVSSTKKERVVLVYGRPNTPRNAFELTVAGVELWAASYARSRQWQVVSLGHPHDDIKLSNGMLMQSLGKLSLAQYSDFLVKSSVGLSLMVSPHPSYPPLEMAEFGIRVVTNHFQNKNLSQRIPNVVSLRSVTPSSIAEAIGRCCNEFEQAGLPVEFGRAFLGGGNEFPFISDLIRQLHR